MYVATGYGGNGMVYSGVAALILTDIITKGESQWEKLFDPNRVKAVAGFSNFSITRNKTVEIPAKHTWVNKPKS